MKPSFEDEIQLLGWGDSSTSGPWIKFRVLNEQALEPFRMATLAKGNTAGQRYACVLVEIGDDELPIEDPHLLAQGAALLAKDGAFQGFLAQKSGRIVVNERDATESIKTLCGIRSRVEIDDDPEIGLIWKGLVKEFNQWMMKK